MPTTVEPDVTHPAAAVLPIYTETLAAVASGRLLSAPQCEVCTGTAAGLCHCGTPDIAVQVPVESPAPAGPEFWFQATSPPRHATQPVDECDGADRPGWIEPPEPVHRHDGDTQVMPAVSPDPGPPGKTTAARSDADGGVARSA